MPLMVRSRDDPNTGRPLVGQLQGTCPQMQDAYGCVGGRGSNAQMLGPTNSHSPLPVARAPQLGPQQAASTTHSNSSAECTS